MHCAICDKMLTDIELVWNKDLGSWEPCGKCLEIALEAAYSGGFTRPGDEVFDEEDELDGELPVLDDEFDIDDMSERPGFGDFASFKDTLE